MRAYTANMYWGTVHSCVYELSDMFAAWTKEEGQGHTSAVQRGPWCVIVDADDPVLAAKLSRDFCEDYFNIPTCTHWDGKTLSLYCGDAGSGTYALTERVFRWLNTKGYFVRYGGSTRIGQELNK